MTSISMRTRVHNSDTSVSRTPGKFYKINFKMSMIIHHHCKIRGFLLCLNSSLVFICYLFIYLLAALDLRYYLFIYLLAALDLRYYLYIYWLCWISIVIYLFIYWLRWISVLARGFSCCSGSQSLQAEAHRLSCLLPHGIRALPPGTKPPPPALEGGLSMTTPPGKAPKILVFIPVFCYVYGWING